MRAAGANFETIAVALRRPVSSVHGHIRWHSMTPEQREHRNQMMRARKRRTAAQHAPYLKGANLKIHNKVDPVIPCPVALAERDRRLALLPVSLTALLCGDPLPGRSALDRR